MTGLASLSVLTRRRRSRAAGDPPEQAGLMRLILAVAVDAGRLDMFDAVFDRWQPDVSRSSEELETVATLRDAIAEVVAGRFEQLRAYSLAEFDVEADDLLEALGVPVPELERNGD